MPSASLASTSDRHESLTHTRAPAHTYYTYLLACIYLSARAALFVINQHISSGGPCDDALSFSAGCANVKQRRINKYSGVWLVFRAGFSFAVVMMGHERMHSSIALTVFVLLPALFSCGEYLYIYIHNKCHCDVRVDEMNRSAESIDSGGDAWCYYMQLLRFVVYYINGVCRSVRHRNSARRMVFWKKYIYTDE